MGTPRLEDDAMSACDTCSQPGACCTNIPLPSLPTDETALEITARLVGYWPPQNPLPLPFFNPRKRTINVAGTEGEVWIVSCAALGPDGRCTEYEHQPYYPCGIYEAGSDNLCAQHVPNIGLCPGMAEPTPTFQTFWESRT